MGMRDPDVLSNSVMVSPIAGRTRKKTTEKLQQQMGSFQLDPPETPSEPGKGTDHYRDLFGDFDVDSPESEESMELSPYSPAPKEAQDTFFTRTKDEQDVNVALLLPLGVLTTPFEDCFDWSIHRMAFIAKFGSASFEARTDGYLEDLKTGKVTGIVEVKSALRTRDIAIHMQESAEMVAWITDEDQRPKMLPGR